MEILLVLGALFLGFILVLISIPSILKIARAKKLYEPFNKQKIHTQLIPPLGGVSIFFGVTLSTIIATDGYSFESLKYIIAAVIMMFFIGLNDDFLIITYKKKLIVQLFAAVLLTTLGNIQFTNLHGILGFYEISYFTGLFFTLYAIVVIINAFNLIDGIDGLASGLAMLAGIVFGIWFYLAEHIPYAILSFAFVGSLAAFFLYNVFGDRNKLFMGDSGSLVVGVIISAIVIQFNEFNIVKTIPFAVDAAPVVSFAIIIVPLVDTLRVMSIRIMKRKSPFVSDTNHIHHRMLSIIPNHFKVTVIIIAVNALLIGLALIFNNISFNINLQFSLIFLIAALLAIVPSRIIRNSQHREIKKSQAN
ncbi:MAG: undecaprenyl/decaprenyl-phosphate alpha-N-acetylglucosaminyl 1-phosphate transferase [Prolixibacteraceae bacterium]|jgi:UDP-GlcNAc:undecaprenyl-phosphate/decaprenyl-phosphate GlcNAc-1-phosphate transferase|nr:undecaprenyl/decaprenyl-phosphate alpha-N-acetylglucosaminyl 1-phosphate transferase [Prolixibacteraceae bacterium]MBT6767238.1 undecaprenyl/decaprenyl-phosphate alpha-N-acetylglucosaminyl 1-phosphate transferase [Prolixibacteraceae bacterium]MBT6998792.1 undecaprenyl/decaprenyl-phosphate alpha-N-acetylglucosaminyl 1-phosphate transferase [Prolixibacteraceae bacterium]MBT7394950.1 undecaprenyl/decaprenyl-phosphate alpha-N-acetylglucosaminyl 1-phosphate transferase [Prolixibacteraceae bacteriu